MHECAECGAWLPSPQSLANHAREHHVEGGDVLEQLVTATMPADPRLTLILGWLALRYGGTPDALADLLGLDPGDCVAAAAGRPHRLSVSHQLRVCHLTLTFAERGRAERWTAVISSAVTRSERQPDRRGVTYVVGSGDDRATVTV